MAKSYSAQAIVISLKPSGENNATVCLFSQEEGIIYATLYGGRKSKLKSLVSPWNCGTAYLSYTNQNFLKISDFDVKTYHLSFRENLLKNQIASLAAELAIKTKCAGSVQKCWHLTKGFIDGLDFCTTDEQCIAGMIRFLWRYIELMGLQPEPFLCASCKEEFTDGAFFSAIENTFTCRTCTHTEHSLFIRQGGMKYLASITSLLPKEARNVFLPKDAVGELKEFLFFLIESSSNTKLNSLRNGASAL